jgi:hypothetical protein
VGTELKRFDYRRKDFQGGVQDNEILYSIIRSCPDLVVLNAYCDQTDELFADAGIAYTQSDVQASSFGHSLQFLTWDEALVGPIQPIFYLLEEYGKIEVLVLLLKTEEYQNRRIS